MEPTVAALVLAAGASTRMGGDTPKQLLPLGGRPVLRRCLETLVAAGVDRIVVVLAPGAGADSAIAGIDVTVAVNPRRGSEMAESIRIGLPRIDPAATGVLLCLADHPLVAPGTVRALASAHGACPGAILIPTFGGRRGHPALFPVEVIREVLGGRTLREARDAHPGAVRECPVEDDGVLFDMDTRQDYQAACDRLARTS